MTGKFSSHVWRTLFRQMRFLMVTEKKQFSKLSEQRGFIWVSRFLIEAHGIHTTDDMVWAVLNPPKPHMVKELQASLGFVKNHTKFLPTVSLVLNPLHKLLHKNAVWNWNQECEQTFHGTKQVVLDAGLVSVVSWWQLITENINEILGPQCIKVHVPELNVSWLHHADATRRGRECLVLDTEGYLSGSLPQLNMSHPEDLCVTQSPSVINTAVEPQ